MFRLHTISDVWIRMFDAIRKFGQPIYNHNLLHRKLGAYLISVNSALVTRSIVVDTFAAGKLFNVNNQILMFDLMEHSDNRIKK